MAKNIQYLGRVNLPFEKILSIIKSKSTKVNTTNDTEDTAHIMGRNKQQLAFSKMIFPLVLLGGGGYVAWRALNKK